MSHNLTREFFENLKFMVNNITNLRFNLADPAKSASLLIQKHLTHKKAMHLVSDLSNIIKEPANISMKDLILTNNQEDPAFKLFEQITIFIHNTIKKIQEKSKTITKNGNLLIELEELIRSIKNTQHNIIQLKNASNIIKPNNILSGKLESLNHALSDLLLTSNKIIHPISNTTKVAIFSDNHPKNNKRQKVLKRITEDQHKTNLHQRTKGRHKEK